MAVREAITDNPRATTAFGRMQATQAPSSSMSTSHTGGVAPMDIGAINKAKGYKGKGYSRGKGYGYKGEAGKGYRKGYKGMSKGKHKSNAPIGQGYGHKGTGW